MSDYDKDRLSDYVDVPARIAEFRAKHPDGSLQPANPAEPYKIEKIGDRVYIVVVVAAYRTPDDARPGIGMAYEQWPGKTPYTRDSELQNAETSAWGRAIVAVLAADTKRSVASAEEVRNRQADEGVRQQEEATRQIEQEATSDLFVEEIQGALDPETIADIGARVRNAKGAGRITGIQYDRLGRRAVARLAELKPAEVAA
jgi:hypothetical protein